MVLPVFDYCDVVWHTLNDTALTQTRKKLQTIKSRKNHRHVSVIRTKHR